MTSITPPRDDEGAVRRRLHLAVQVPVDKARRTAAGPAARSVPQQREAADPSRRPRGPERRRQERRRRRSAVLLDTRSPVGNRRRGTRRGEDRRLPRRHAGEAGGPPAGTVLDDDLCA